MNAAEAGIPLPVEPTRTGEDPDTAAAEALAFLAEIAAMELAKCGGQRDECRDRNPRTGEQDAMQRFSINDENEIQALHAESALPAGSTEFHSEKELAKVASDWPAARLVEIWNGLTGVTAVRKFKDRATAVNRVWKQIQALEAPAPEPVRKSRPPSGKKAAARLNPRLAIPGCHVPAPASCAPSATAVVKVLPAGFEFDGRHFPSLSAIAREVTGTRWNGFLFFGLVKPFRHARHPSR